MLFVLSAAGIYQQAEQFVLSAALFRRKGDQNIPLRQFQRLSDQLQRRFHQTLFQLNQLVGHHDLRATGLAEPVVHDQIVGRGLMPDVHDQNTGGNGVRLPLEIGLHQPGPALFFRAGHLGIAVSRQIDKIDFLVNFLKINGLGLSRLLRCPRIGLPVHQCINQ